MQQCRRQIKFHGEGIAFGAGNMTKESTSIANLLGIKEAALQPKRAIQTINIINWRSRLTVASRGDPGGRGGKGRLIAVHATISPIYDNYSSCPFLVI
ncbi:hypothetical protein E2562_030850 [Oryza meyeriana var. granulata]|uniref:Uncharacterized protein n=1 Tax=Oryza meyeriana var. granulata TaxID=110450 RepID=A0A6G1F001_9ORYZ|nr:hypothetical protein E2562_030850 [Oryza meyeriana var. granulata]